MRSMNTSAKRVPRGWILRIHATFFANLAKNVWNVTADVETVHDDGVGPEYDDEALPASDVTRLVRANTAINSRNTLRRSGVGNNRGSTRSHDLLPSDSPDNPSTNVLCFRHKSHYVLHIRHQFMRARSHSRYSLEALALLGELLRTARIERKMPTRILAERTGISRDMLYRIEKGDPRCEIGVVFELASILGVPLFAPDLPSIQGHRGPLRDRLLLLPKTIRTPPTVLKDDF